METKEQHTEQADLTKQIRRPDRKTLKEDTMLHRPFWTKRRLTGMLLLLGAMLFWIGAVMPLTDPKGNFIWYLPSREWLLVIFAHPVLWQWTNLLFLGGSVVTVLGLVLLTTILWAAGDHALAPLGLSAFFFGTGLWVIQLVFRLSVDLWAAQETARTGVVPTVYEPLNLWIRSLFVIYSVLAQSGIGAYGAALLATRVLPQWLGWTSIVFSLAGLSLLAFIGDAPPLMYYLMPMLIGTLLLLRRPQVASEQDDRPEHASPVPSGHTSRQNRDRAS